MHDNSPMALDKGVVMEVHFALVRADRDNGGVVGHVVPEAELREVPLSVADFLGHGEVIPIDVHQLTRHTTLRSHKGYHRSLVCVGGGEGSVCVECVCGGG